MIDVDMVDFWGGSLIVFYVDVGLFEDYFLIFNIGGIFVFEGSIFFGEGEVGEFIGMLYDMNMGVNGLVFEIMFNVIVEDSGVVII